MRRLVLCASIVVAFAACEKSSTQNDDMSVGDMEMIIEQNDLAVEDAPPRSCALLGEDCVNNASCCGGMCDPMALVCTTTTPMCMPPGAMCSSPTDCCNLSCNNGTCSMATTCIADNMACGAGVMGSCCSGTCNVNNTCTPLSTICHTAGNPCMPTPDGGIPDGSSQLPCCSGLCKDGFCALKASYCTQPGDICYRSEDCCTGICQKAAGATDTTPGACQELVFSVSCAIDGIVCDGCGDCCSRLCAPFAATGIKICQPPSGCRVYGDLCKTNKDCCGGDTASGLPGAGLVKCTPIAGTGLGYCDHPTSGGGGGMGGVCNPEGNVCHYNNMDYVCEGGSSTRNNCCDCGDPTNKKCCYLDTVGIPRCNTRGGFDGGMCIAPGGVCAFDGDCCGGLPCVPDSTGTLKCLQPSDMGMNACVASGGTCTTTGDCCIGLTCVVPPGGLAGTCTTIVSEVDMANMPICAQIGQSCEQNPCCPGLVCSRPELGECLGADHTGCSCTAFVP